MGTYEGYAIPAFAFEKERKKVMKRAIEIAEKEKEEKRE